MWKRILNKVLSSEKLLDVVIVVFMAALDREFTPAEIAEIKKKALEAIEDIVLS